MSPPTGLIGLMNEVVNNNSLAGDKFISEIDLGQPGFI